MGYFLALLSAISWTVGTISFKKSNHSLSPHILNLYKNLLAFFVLLIILICCSFYTDENFWIISKNSFFLIFLSGMIGSGLADQIYIRSLFKVGANFLSVIASSLGIFVLLFAFLLNYLFPLVFPSQNWPPHLYEIIGFLFIIFAIFYSSWDSSSYKDIPIKMVLFALSAFMFMGLSANLTNSAIHLNQGGIFNILAIILVRFIPGILFQFGLIFFKNESAKDVFSIFSLDKKTFIFVNLGAIMMSLVAIVFWIVGMNMELHNVTLFSLLAQTSNIMIFICSWLILKEKINNRKILGIVLSFIGVVLIVLAK